MRPSIVAGTLVATVLLTACGSGEQAGEADAGGAVETLEMPLPEPAPGPVPDLMVDPASSDNPLPDVAVRQINGDGGWVQFKNYLPSQKPILVWFWAPH